SQECLALKPLTCQHSLVKREQFSDFNCRVVFFNHNLASSGAANLHELFRSKHAFDSICQVVRITGLYEQAESACREKRAYRRKVGGDDRQTTGPRFEDLDRDVVLELRNVLQGTDGDACAPERRSHLVMWDYSPDGH